MHLVKRGLQLAVEERGLEERTMEGEECMPDNPHHIHSYFATGERRVCMQLTLVNGVTYKEVLRAIFYGHPCAALTFIGENDSMIEAIEPEQIVDFSLTLE